MLNIVHTDNCKCTLNGVSLKHGKEVKTMSKQKKKSGGKPDSYINLTAALLNLITAVLLLIEKLTE